MSTHTYARINECIWMDGKSSGYVRLTRRPVQVSHGFEQLLAAVSIETDCRKLPVIQSSLKFPSQQPIKIH